MRFINLEQGSAEWHDFRSKGLGSSDAPVVLEKSKYLTRHQLWQQKLGLLKSESGSFIANVGTRLEPKARAHFALTYGIDVNPACAIHDDFDFLRASFDGICEKEKVFLELKLTGAKNFEWIRKNQCPLPEHVDQVAHQFLVSKYERAFYAAYLTDEKYQEIIDFIAVPVTPDPLYQRTLFDQLTAFWDLVLTQDPPELSDKDVYEFADEKMIEKAKTFLALKALCKKNDEHLEKLADELKAIASVHAKVKVGPIQVSKVVRKGSVNYKAIPELKSVDLEKYRGQPSSFQQISEVKA